MADEKDEAEVEGTELEVDRTFRVKPGERILLVVDEEVEEDDDEDEDDVEAEDLQEEDDEDEDEDELLNTNVPSEISDDVLEAELRRRKEANPSSDR